VCVFFVYSEAFGNFFVVYVPVWIESMQEIDKLRAERNAVASAMKGKLDLARREELIEQGKQLKEQVAELEGKLAVLSERLQQEGQRIPNMTHPSVPIGSEDVTSIRKEATGVHISCEGPCGVGACS
jgi:seryl-tRNA synthetase